MQKDMCTSRKLREFARQLYAEVFQMKLITYSSLAIILNACIALSQPGEYRIVKNAKVGGVGGFDYVYADSAGRRLYIPRSGNGARVTVFNLDTLEPVGEISD